MDRCFNRGAEARSHVHPVSAQAQRRDQSAAVTEASGGNHGDLDFVGSHGNQNQARDVIFARMTGAFEAVDRDCIDADALRGQRMTHRRAFVDHDDTVLLEMRDVLLRVVACGLHDFDAAVDDCLTVLRIRRRIDRRQNCQIHRERFVGHGTAALDLLAQSIGSRLCQRRQNAESAGVGYGGRQFSAAHPHHAALDDRVVDADQFGETCLEFHFSGAYMRSRTAGWSGVRHASSCTREELNTMANKS